MKMDKILWRKRPACDPAEGYAKPARNGDGYATAKRLAADYLLSNSPKLILVIVVYHSSNVCRL